MCQVGSFLIINFHSLESSTYSYNDMVIFFPICTKSKDKLKFFKVDIEIGTNETWKVRYLKRRHKAASACIWVEYRCERNKWRVKTCIVTREIMSMTRAAAEVKPKRIPHRASPLVKWTKRKPKKIQRVDQIWIAFREIMPRTPASSVFNLKPAGLPISHTHPVRNQSFVKSCAKFETHKKADSAVNHRGMPTRFPRRTSKTIFDHIECLWNAAFSANSTHDQSLYK